MRSTTDAVARAERATASSSVGWAQDAARSDRETHDPTTTTGDAPVTTASGLELQHVHPGVRPQDDLYRHVNGRWLATHEIPADRAMDGAFRALYDQAEVHVREIITDLGEQAAAGGAEHRPVPVKDVAIHPSNIDHQRI